MQLAGYFQDKDRLLPFSEVDEKLGNLLRDFGPKRKRYQPKFPFWRLQKDGVWEIPAADRIEVSPNGDVRRGDLFRYEVAGGFTEDIARQLQDDSSMVSDVVQIMLDAHFPDTIHEDILQATGIDLTFKSTGRQKRDPNFRVNILKAYEYRLRGMWLRRKTWASAHCPGSRPTSSGDRQRGLT